MDEVVRADQGMPHASAVEKAAGDGGEASPLKAEGPSKGARQQKERTPAAAQSRTTDATNSQAVNDRRTDGRSADGRAQGPVAPHSKWNKKANQIGEDGRKQPNRPERPR